MKKIYIDFDDVLAETAQSIQKICAQHFSKNIAFHEFKSFNLQETFNLSDNEFITLNKIIHEPALLENIPPVPGALEGINILKENGFSISIITGRPPDTRQPSIKWLNKHVVPFTEIKFVDKYNRFDAVTYSDDVLNLDHLKKHTFTYAIEDAINMALFLSHTMHTQVLLHDRPWNQGIETHQDFNTKIRRCPDWKSIVTHILHDTQKASNP